MDMDMDMEMGRSSTGTTIDRDGDFNLFSGHYFAITTSSVSV